MPGPFCYDLKARFYGLFIQLPWSFFITLCLLFPVLYGSSQQTRILLIELTIYWTLFATVLWTAKDIYTQRFLHEFSVNGGKIHVYKNRKWQTCYRLDQIKSVKSIARNSRISRRMLGAQGMMIKFEDGNELPVLNQITGYEKFNILLKRNSIVA